MTKTSDSNRPPDLSTPLSGEGGLAAPTRLPLDWQNPDFYNEDSLDTELRRVFDICHGCRRCFNLCDSFPRLFDLVDESPTGELDSVPSSAFDNVVEACTLCDMCYMTKCPYVPPHPFSLDFPHLMLRHRAVTFQKEGAALAVKILTDTDTLGKTANTVAPVANWAGKVGNKLTRPGLESILGIDRRAELPKFCGKTLQSRFKELQQQYPPNLEGLWKGTKVALYATCYGNYNNPEIGEAFYKILAHMGATVVCVYEGCCGMPKLEHGNIPDVASKARHISQALKGWIDQGYTLVPLVPSCTLMMTSEWPLLLPTDPAIARLARNTQDMPAFLMSMIKTKGSDPIMPGLSSVAHKRAVIHLACHARALNVGPKAWDLLRLIPDLQVEKIERCSGHGGSWGFMKDNFDIALKVGKPVMQKVSRERPDFLTSECPLAARHIDQGTQLLEKKNGNNADSNGKSEEKPRLVAHPIQILAMAYGLD